MGVRRMSSIRRSRKKRSRLSSRRRFRAAPSHRAVPPAFAAYNAAKADAESQGATMFEHNGKRYARHTWDNGVAVWRRA